MRYSLSCRADLLLGERAVSRHTFWFCHDVQVSIWRCVELVGMETQRQLTWRRTHRTAYPV